jgi:kynureninase
LQTQDIIDLINKDDEIAVVMLSGVQYYTGQFFEIEKITKAGKEAVSLKEFSRG